MALAVMPMVLASCHPLDTQEAWSTTLDQRFVDPYPAVAAGNFICFGYDEKWPRDMAHREGPGVLAALEATTGRVVWKQPATLGGELLIGEGHVFYRGADEAIHALDAATGREKWRAEKAGRLLAVHGGVLVMSDGTFRVELRDAATGEVRFKRPSGNRDAAALVDGDTLYLSGDGITAMSLTTGKVLWTSKVNFALKRVFANLLIGQKTYVRETVALRASDGEKVWDVEGSVMGSHEGVLALERMHVGPEYRAHKIDAQTGRELSDESQEEFARDFPFHENLTVSGVSLSVPYQDHYGSASQRLQAYSRESISKDEWIEARVPGTGKLIWKTAKVWGWVSDLVAAGNVVIRAETEFHGDKARVRAFRTTPKETQ